MDVGAHRVDRRADQRARRRHDRCCSAITSAAMRFVDRAGAFAANGRKRSPDCARRSACTPSSAITSGGTTGRCSERGHGVPVARRALEAAGIPVYENEAVRLDKAGRRSGWRASAIRLAFVPSRRRCARAAASASTILPARLAKVTDDAPVILMAHEPDIAVRVPERVSLSLSGHTHGGQVRLFGWSPVVPSRYGNRYRLRPCARAMRFDRLGRARLQHHAGPPWRAAGDRAGRRIGGAAVKRTGAAGEQCDAADAWKAAVIAGGCASASPPISTASPIAIARCAARRASCI